MSHSKSQSVDGRHASKGNSPGRINSSVFQYLKDRKERNRSRERLSEATLELQVPSVLADAAFKRSVTDDQKFKLVLDLLQAKIAAMGEHTIELESRMRTINSTFSCFCDVYSDSPTSRQTISLLGKLRQQIKTSLPFDRLGMLQREIKKQVEETKAMFASVMAEFQQKSQEQTRLLRVKMEHDRSNSQLRLQSTIDALSYNNLILSKLNRPDCENVRVELSKYHHLRKKHQDLLIENERIRTNSALQRFCKSTQLQTKHSDEQYDTAVDENAEEDS